MNIYKHQGNGHYIGSCIVIVSENITNAEVDIRKLLDKNGLKDEELDIVEMDIYPGKKIVEINGDY